MQQLYTFALTLLFSALPLLTFAQPANDDCADAVALTVDETSATRSYVAFDTDGATRSTTDPDCSNMSDDDDIWFTFVATDDIMRIAWRNLVNSDPAVGFGYSLSEGPDCASLTSLECNTFNATASNGGVFSLNGAEPLTSGTTYTLRVFSNGTGNTLSGELTIIARPANDQCDAAQPVVVGSTESIFYNDFDTNNAVLSDGSICGNRSSNWFSFTGSGGVMRIAWRDVVAANGTSGFAYSLIDGTCGNAAIECRGFNASANASGATTLNGGTPLVAGRTYHLRVFLPGTVGTGEVTVFTNAPENTTCAEAITVPVLATRPLNYQTANTTDAVTPAADRPSCAGVSGDDIVYYNFTPTSSVVRLTWRNYRSSDPSAIGFGVASGTCGNLTELDCGFFAVGNTGGSFTLRTDFTPGEEYVLQLFSRGADIDAQVEFALLDIPENDDCATATDVVINDFATATESYTANNSYSGTDGDFGLTARCPGDSGGELYYRFTPTTPTTIFEVTQSDFSTVRASIYSDDCAAPELVTCEVAVGGTGSDVIEGLTVGTPYLIRLYDFNDNDLGTATFNLQADNSLPATLTSFTGQAEEKRNVLNWATATETGVDYFLLEANVTGGVGNWEAIGQVEASNLVGRTQAYALAHATPAQETYYRLTTVDYDGSRQLSDVISVRRATGLTDGNFQLTPNPAVGTTELRFTPVAGVAQVTVHDATGRQLLARQIDTASGRTTLGLQDLAPGAYLVRLKVGDNTFTQRLIKR